MALSQGYRKVQASDCSANACHRGTYDSRDRPSGLCRFNPRKLEERANTAYLAHLGGRMYPQEIP